MKRVFWVCFGLVLGFGLPLPADVTLPALISSHMVIQRNSPFTVWGWADPGERVTVRADWLAHPLEVETGEDRAWRISLPPPEAGGPYRMVIKGYNSIVLDNILCGEVWLASGQSNMAWSLKKSAGAERELPRARHEEIRLFHVNRSHASVPREDVKGRWQSCEPEAVDNFSAVAYYFARKLHRHLRVPVGIIGAYKGGSPIEAWIAGEALRKGGFMTALEDMWRKWERRAPGDGKRYEKVLKEWREKKAVSATPEKPRMPVSLKNLARPHRRPAALYNAMIAPLRNYGIKGVIWYQGENNVSRPTQYAGLFRALIKSWASGRNRPFLPFYYSQIAPYDYQAENDSASTLRAAQGEALKLPHTGMAVITDLGNLRDIHPVRKREVGERLARLALAGEYGVNNITPRGPRLKSARREGRHVWLSFDVADAGLTKKAGELTGFELAGGDGRFYAAVAEIHGNRVLVHSPFVTEPRRVRFGWHINVIPNLFNGEGLPAYPFFMRLEAGPGK